MGNKFAQGLHDGGTLVSKRKYQALALQFIAPDWKKNLVVTIGLKKSSKNTDADVATCGRRSWMSAAGGWSTRTSWGACGATGRQRAWLVCWRWRRRRCVRCTTRRSWGVGNRGARAHQQQSRRQPLPAGRRPRAARAQARRVLRVLDQAGELERSGEDLGNVPDIKIQVDYNTTRIAAVHGLLHSELRLNRALRAYEVQFNPGWAFKADDWQAVAEFEGVLNCTKVTSTLAQRERGFNGAFTPLIKTLALTKLRADELYVIDMPNVKISPHVPRVAIKIDNLTDMGQTARVRAILEGERRWCGNQTEELTGASVNMGKTSYSARSSTSARWAATTSRGSSARRLTRSSSRST